MIRLCNWQNSCGIPSPGEEVRAKCGLCGAKRAEKSWRFVEVENLSMLTGAKYHFLHVMLFNCWLRVSFHVEVVPPAVPERYAKEFAVEICLDGLGSRGSSG